MNGSPIYSKYFLVLFLMLGYLEAQATTPSALSTVDKVAKLYLQSLSATQALEEAENKRYQEFITKKNGKVDIADIQENFGTVEQLKVAYMLHNNSKYGVDTTKSVNIAESTLADLRLFCGEQDSLEEHVFAHLNKTKTLSGAIALQTLLAEPSKSPEVLKERQAFIKLLVQNEELYQSLVAKLEKIRAGEVELLSITRTMQQEVEQYYREVLFEGSLFKPLNRNATAMQGFTYWLAGREFCQKITIDLLTATLLSLAAEPRFRSMVLSEYFKFAYGFYVFMPVESSLRIMSGLMGALNVYLLGDGLYRLNKRLPILEKLKDKMGKIAQTLVITHREVVTELLAHPQALTLFPALVELDIKAVGEHPSTQIINLLEKLHDSAFKAGKAAAAFSRKDEIKENFADSYKLFGMVDAYTSIATLFKTHAHNKNAGYCFVEYSAAKTPIIELTGFWHPLLDPATVVTNNIVLGQGNIPSNAFITGPNAGGKTTALRSIGLAVLLAQSLGIAPAKQARLTPFTHIATYLNVADSEGKDSLFQAEMRRAHVLLDTVKALPADAFSFVIIDEIFTGTNPKEGTAAAYGVAKKLGSYNNSMALITTHFVELTNMTKETKRFTNFKVSVRHVGNKFEFPYKLEPGVTDQHIALELLDKDGFDEDVVNAAKDYLKRK